MREHFSGDRSQFIHAHQHHLRPTQFRQRIEVKRAFTFRRVFVSRKKCYVRILGAMSDGNSGVGWRRNRRCNTWHNFKIDSRRHQRFGFFPAPAKNKRIATLEANHIFSEPRFLDQQCVDFVLRKRFFAGSLSGKNDFGVWAGPPQHLGIDERVVNDDVGLLQ